jgi:hypothetical protein
VHLLVVVQIAATTARTTIDTPNAYRHKVLDVAIQRDYDCVFFERYHIINYSIPEVFTVCDNPQPHLQPKPSHPEARAFEWGFWQ